MGTDYLINYTNKCNNCGAELYYPWEEYLISDKLFKGRRVDNNEWVYGRLGTGDEKISAIAPLNEDGCYVVWSDTLELYSEKEEQNNG